MSFSSHWQVIGIIFIFIGLIVKFEVKVITSEENQELTKREPNNS